MIRQVHIKDGMTTMQELIGEFVFDEECRCTFGRVSGKQVKELLDHIYSYDWLGVQLLDQDINNYQFIEDNEKVLIKLKSE